MICGRESEYLGLNDGRVKLGIYIEGTRKQKYCDLILLLSVALAFVVFLPISVLI